MSTQIGRALRRRLAEPAHYRETYRLLRALRGITQPKADSAPPSHEQASDLFSEAA